MRRFLWIVFFIVYSVDALTLDSYLDELDIQHLRTVFESSANENDLSAVFFGVAGQKLLGNAVVNPAKACEKAQSFVDDKDVESLYYTGGLLESFGTSCKFQLSNAQATITSVIADTKSTAQSLFYAALAAKSLSVKVDTKKLAESLAAVSKKDGSASVLSYVFNAAASLLDEHSLTQFLSKIEDCVAQADEIDKKYLVFEGGLTPTSLAVTGIYGLAQKAKKAPTIKPEDVLKLTNYLLSRKSSKLARPAYYMLQALFLLTRNQFHYPVVFKTASPRALTSKNANFALHISDLFGKPIDGLHVVTDSAQDTTSKKDLFAKKALQFNAVKKTYELNFIELKPAPGFYIITVSATSTDKRLVGNTGMQSTVKVTTEIMVEDVQVAVVDRDQSMTSSNAHKVKQFSKLPTVLEADTHQKLIMKFLVKDKTKNSPMKVHQAFVMFIQANTNREIAFVAEADSSNAYSFDVNFLKAIKDFDYQSGKYHMKLVLGDALIGNAMEWIVADVTLKFPAHDKPTESGVEHISYEKKPEIHHVFREADRRPSQLVSDLFTGLVLFPLLLLLVLWFRTGANLSNFSFDVYAIGFHLGLLGIFGLYFMFWIKLNMFETLKYLAGIGCFTFLAGNRMLKHMAEKRKQKTE